ncbi:MAG: NAD-glutamate dehydrogenase [Hyphomicrobiaceae bacterium]
MANDPAVKPTAHASATLAHLGEEPASATGRDLFASLLLASTDEASLAELDPEALAIEVNAAFAALRRKPPGRHAVRLRDGQLKSRTGAVPVTVLEIVNDDRPFLLDSVMGEVQARGHQVLLVLHPIFKTRRTPEGVLDAVTAPGDSSWHDGHQESYIAVVMERLPVAAWAPISEAMSSLLDQVRTVVDDWRPMLARVKGAIAELGQRSGAAPADQLAESVSFLEWLVAGNFTFLGVRDYRLLSDPEHGELVPVDGAGLGILRDPSVHVLRRGSELVAMTPEVRRFFFQPNPLIITKSNVVARVHRRVHMDYVGIKRYAADGRPDGEVRVIGLFTSSAYTTSPRLIPLLRHKIARVAREHGAPPESHAGKALANVLETFPRDELFQIGVQDLARWSAGILNLELRPRVRAFVRADRFDRFVSVLLFVPRDRFTTTVRERIGAYLANAFDGRISAFSPMFSDTPLVRVHFIVGRQHGETPVVSEAELESAITGIVRTWDDQLVDAFAATGEARQVLAARYGRAFSAGYAERFTPEHAVADAARIEQLTVQRPVAMSFARLPGSPPTRIQASVMRLGGPIRLSERVPVLENLGFSVIDERSYTIAPRVVGMGGTPQEAVLHDMVLETADATVLDIPHHEARLEAAFLAVLAGDTEGDSFNHLIIKASADWREAALIRAYAAHLRQLGSAFGPRYIAETVAHHAGATRDLIDLFHARLDPARAATAALRAAGEAPIRARIEAALAKVQSLDEDRILRQLLTLVLATVRTNFFVRDAAGNPPATIALKYDGSGLTVAPEPRPYREIWVWSPRVEAVHLRFAPIARGGIRWSDRAQDFRTEVLGLAKAQHVKNAVIVPAGAKGGFYPKQLPRGGSREEVQKAGTDAYKIFVSAMLDITDNIVDGQLVPPPGVVRLDGDDPYLVVAADKGTATFSDTANGIAADHAFWLGDAFASGGSAGYDHKKMAITARGAWECVKRHFRELDRDIQSESVRVVGVGDMSGDVFGNGMLLSPEIRLVAAFDHRDIFLDPDPDPRVAIAERRRIFQLPRSSWADYDRNSLSKGGGVFSRQAKSIALTDEVRHLLKIDALSLTPAEVMNAILKCETDLLWFGGIGTYIKASSESDADVGDRGNDAIRVTAAELRTKVVGEGANLGMTQRGRVEAALRGIRLNTDFIDNSAGVNSSDQEVNIKIALGPVVAGGRLPLVERNQLLSSMTADVAAAVLRNNYQQSLALSLAERQGHAELGPNARLMRALEQRRVLDRRLESLPTDAQLVERDKAARGFVRPELAVLSSYAKIALLHDLLASQVPDNPVMEPLLLDYFPPALQRAYPAELARHRLRREIIATTLTNGLVNRLGAPTPLRLAEEAMRPVADTAYAFMAARSVFDLAAIWKDIDALDGRMRGEAQLGLYARVRELAIRTTGYFLRDGAAVTDLGGTIARHAAGLAELQSSIGDVLPEALARQRTDLAAALMRDGTPEALAERLAVLSALTETPRFVALADLSGRSVTEAARTSLGLGESLRISDLVRRARLMRATDDFDRLAIAGSMAALEDNLRLLALSSLRSGFDRDGLSRWASRHKTAIDVAERDLVRIAAPGEISLARLTVAATRIAELARATASSGVEMVGSGEQVEGMRL